MLVLSRRENESIVIGDRITVKVVKIRGNQVRLAIEAPKEVRVLRTELVDRGPAEDRCRLSLVRAHRHVARASIPSIELNAPSPCS